MPSKSELLLTCTQQLMSGPSTVAESWLVWFDLMIANKDWDGQILFDHIMGRFSTLKFDTFNHCIRDICSKLISSYISLQQHSASGRKQTSVLNFVRNLELMHPVQCLILLACSSGDNVSFTRKSATLNKKSKLKICKKKMGKMEV